SVVLPGPGRIDREGTLERGPAAGVDQVLDGDGDAIERPHGLVPAPALRGSGGLAHGALRIHEEERIDDRIDRLDPAQDGGGHLGRCQASRCIGGHELARAEIADRLVVHVSSFRTRSRPRLQSAQARPATRPLSMSIRSSTSSPTTKNEPVTRIASRWLPAVTQVTTP